MYHMGYHLEAQRQQRTIDKKKQALERINKEQSKVASEDTRSSHTSSGSRLGTSRDQIRPPKSANVVGQYYRVGQPVLQERVFSRPEEYQNRWLNKRFHIRHDPELVPLPLRKVDVIHQD